MTILYALFTLDVARSIRIVLAYKDPATPKMVAFDARSIMDDSNVKHFSFQSLGGMRERITSTGRLSPTIPYDFEETREDKDDSADS
jgi:hypothetical protein